MVPVLGRGARSRGIFATGSARAICACASTTRRSSRTTRSATSDLEYLFPIGWSELEGIAHRGDFDLVAHTEASGTKLEWVDGQERYTPHVVEPALGVNRSMLAFMVDAYDEEVVAERERTVLRLHPALAPVKVAVLPLIPRNEDMVGKARALYEELRRAVVAEYDDSGQIGRRYRRQDEIGTPYALTIDEQTLEDDTVTIRDRDSLAQERIPISGARDLRSGQARAGLEDAEAGLTLSGSSVREPRSLGSAKPNLR